VISGLEQALAASHEPGLAGLHEALWRALGPDAGTASFAGERAIKSRVFRLRFSVGGGERSLVAKRLEPAEARRCEFVVQRWLPAVGLERAAPRLLATSAAGEACVWHVYEDVDPVGAGSLERDAGPERVAAVARLLARLHVRFASHALLPECRAAGSDYGLAFFAGNLRAAIAALESWRDGSFACVGHEATLCDRLLARLGGLLASEPVRARAIADSGGPDTLLHGDPWTSNAFVTPGAAGLEARLVDWDRAGVGPASYDLSTFLLRFPRARRPAILDLYAAAVIDAGGHMPGREALEMLFETAELSRYANRVLWPARALAAGDTSWGGPELAEVERWFEALEPVLEHPTAAVVQRTRHAPDTNGQAPIAAARRLIVNADDLGACDGINRAIFEAHERGIVTSASLMVEAPGAVAAANASREAPGLSIGLHVDLGRGGPVLTAASAREILARQADRLEALIGRPPTHVDSHRNVHRTPQLLPEFQALADRWHVPLRGFSAVRLLPSFYGQWNGETHPEQISVANLVRLLEAEVGGGVTELICHPGYPDPGLDSSYVVEREIELATLCHADVRRALAALDIVLIGFHELAASKSGAE